MMILHTIGAVTAEFILSILYFPIWWYTKGLLKVIRLLMNEIKSFTHSLRLRTLFTFLLQPMFGLTDRWSKIISFFVRIVHFFILFVVTIIYSVVLIALVVVWIMLPIFIAYNILFHFELVDQLYA